MNALQNNLLIIFFLKGCASYVSGCVLAIKMNCIIGLLGVVNFISTRPGFCSEKKRRLPLVPVIMNGA